MMIADVLVKNKSRLKSGELVIAKPLPGPFINRIKDAWEVFKGRAEAVKFIEVGEDYNNG